MQSKDLRATVPSTILYSFLFYFEKLYKVSVILNKARYIEKSLVLSRSSSRLFFFFKTVSHYVDQTGLEFPVILYLSLLTAGFTGVHHHIQITPGILEASK